MIRLALILSGLALGSLLASPASTLAQPAPPSAPRPTAAASGPALSLEDLPPGFVLPPSFLARFPSVCRGSCSGAAYTRGDEYVASAVTEVESQKQAWQGFALNLVPPPEYSPRWLDPPPVGEEAALFRIKEWVSAGPLYGYDLKWRRGTSLAEVTVLGVSDDPAFTIGLAQRIDAQIGAGEPGDFRPPDQDPVERIVGELEEVRGLRRRGRTPFSMRAPAVAAGYGSGVKPIDWFPDTTFARLISGRDQQAVFAPRGIDTGILRLLGQPVDLARLRTPGPVLGGEYQTQNSVTLTAASWPLGWREEIITAHEYAHSLQDQHFGYDLLADQALGPLPIVDHNSDAVLAFQALIEGSTELTSRLWSERFLRNGSWEALKTEWSQYDRDLGVPPLWQAEARFPYWQGERFANSLYQAGGWAEVNAAYRRPPASSAQVLHPELYAADVRPVRIKPPIAASVAARGWHPLWEDTLGEVGLSAVLEPFLGAERAVSAASGWSGDRYVVVGTGEIPDALALDSAWYGEAEAREFFDALADSLDVRFTGAAARQYEGLEMLTWSTPEFEVLVALRGDRVSFAVAPDRGGLLALGAFQEW